MFICANVDTQTLAHTEVKGGKKASFVLQDVVKSEECA